jgi:alpha-beta hydrolase superfamily lysophospholipase
MPEARTFIYECNTKALRLEAISDNIVLRQAGDLLERLYQARIDQPQRPLLFIAHSLGGLLVKTV